ncbi:MAG TPA: arginine deiminase-related protein [Steroidobacteraceae bacterium]|nr:arginine deiminase-related protein [Steroidobacteraceae bacterium]
MSSDTPAARLAGERRPRRRQCADAVLMVRPAAFGYNPETAASNKFQRQSASAAGVDVAAGRQEFDGLAGALLGDGVRVCVVEDTPEPPKTDAVFPNNWVSFHEDGTVVLYPMQAETRRRERRREVIDQAADRLGFKVARVLDLISHEAHGRYLEGTGSLVLDHSERTAYACLSPRTHPEVVEEWARELGYEPIVFGAVDRGGVPLYHTNVLMCVGEKAVIIGTEAIVPADRGRVIERLRATGREVIEIGHAEIERFAGNMLELGTWDEALGDYRLFVMSETAKRALAAESLARLSACTDEVLAVPVPTIERLGGGSVRCMLAEVFLPS